MDIDFLKRNNLIIFEAIAGSHAYGTALPNGKSDTDIRGIFILPKEHLLGLKYVEQVNDKKNDIVYYELRRFLELAASNNPNILEFFNYPNDCILYKNPLFDLILEHKQLFITKKCKNSFAGYAKSQISKSYSLNKMQNWEATRVEQKTPLDFCYIIKGAQTINLNNILKLDGLTQENCGLSAINNARNMYALFYDASEKLGYKGIQQEDSQKVKLSSIPKNQKPVYLMYYNEDGYSEHAKDWKSYQTWLKERNINRFITNKEHNQGYDSKNIMHLKRLLDMAREIAEGNGIVVRRPNVEELLKIRHGEVSLQSVVECAENELNKIDELFDNSNLPLNVDQDFVHNLLVKIRTLFYEVK